MTTKPLEQNRQSQTRKIRGEALTFDDVLLVPAHSAVLPKEVSTAARLTPTIDRETLASDAGRLGLMRDIHGAVPHDHLAFLFALQNSAEIGDYFLCHAGVDPARPFDKQSSRDLLWMREPFLSHGRALAKVVVHGHTPVQDVDFRAHRINCDTGCCYGGKLTALVLQGAERRVIDVPSLQEKRRK